MNAVKKKIQSIPQRLVVTVFKLTGPMLSWCDFLAGYIGGCAGVIVGHPLDTLKVRGQQLVIPWIHSR